MTEEFIAAITEMDDKGTERLIKVVKINADSYASIIFLIKTYLSLYFLVIESIIGS